MDPYCQKSCGCQGRSIASDCRSILLACQKCWGNRFHPAEKSSVPHSPFVRRALDNKLPAKQVWVR